MAAVSQVRNTNDGAERQFLVGGGEGILVEHLAGCGGTSMILVAVPGGESFVNSFSPPPWRKAASLHKKRQKEHGKNRAPETL